MHCFSLTNTSGSKVNLPSMDLVSPPKKEYLNWQPQKSIGYFVISKQRTNSNVPHTFDHEFSNSDDENPRNLVCCSRTAKTWLRPRTCFGLQRTSKLWFRIGYQNSHISTESWFMLKNMITTFMLTESFFSSSERPTLKPSYAEGGRNYFHLFWACIAEKLYERHSFCSKIKNSKIMLHQISAPTWASGLLDDHERFHHTPR